VNPLDLRRFRKLLPVLLGVVCVLAVPLVAWAAEGQPGGGEGDESVPWNDLIEGIVNFAIFIGALYYFAKKPLKNYLEKRSQAVSSQLQEAGTLRRQAEEKLAEYQRRLEEFDKERQRVLENYRREAEADRQALVEESHRHAERIRADAKTVIEYESKRARAELRERVVQEAIRIARLAIQERLDDPTRERLVREYTEALVDLKPQRPA
jgi:F-type H+-transporting ATPase subunit b